MIDLLDRKPGANHFGRGELLIDTGEWLIIPIFTGCSPRARIGKGEATSKAPKAKPVLSTVRRPTGREQSNVILLIIGSRLGETQS